MAWFDIWPAYSKTRRLRGAISVDIPVQMLWTSGTFVRVRSRRGAVERNIEANPRSEIVENRGENEPAPDSRAAGY